MNQEYIEYDVNHSNLPKGLKLCLSCFSKFAPKHECIECNPSLYSDFDKSKKYIINKKNCLLELTCPVCNTKFLKQRAMANPKGCCSMNCYRIYKRNIDKFNFDVAIKNKEKIERSFFNIEIAL